MLETAHAIQLTLSRITADLYDGKIDTKRATALYYGLSLAMFNVRHLSNPVSSDHVIDLPPAMMNVFAASENPQEFETADVCHPERGRMSEPKDPDAAHTTDNASTFSDPSALSVPLRPLRGTEPIGSPDEPITRSSDAQMPPDLSRFVKRVLRAGPTHPKFHEVSRIYDRYISEKVAG